MERLAEVLLELGEAGEAAALFEGPLAASAGALPAAYGAECVLLARGRPAALPAARPGDATSSAARVRASSL